jgi:hypothetical protein
MDTNVKTSILKQGFGIHSIKKKMHGNRYEPEITLEDKVYPKTNYNHQPGNVVVDEIPTKIKEWELHIIRWTLIKDQQLMNFNLRTNTEPQMVKINA